MFDGNVDATHILTDSFILTDILPDHFILTDILTDYFILIKILSGRRTRDGTSYSTGTSTQSGSRT